VYFFSIASVTDEVVEGRRVESDQSLLRVNEKLV
jgi:hypothetical protein